MICAITDVNRLGQSQATQFGHDLGEFERRWRAFGWRVIRVDGHDVRQLLNALARARATRGRPTMILARTLKGKGVSLIEGKEGWHGKPLRKGEETDRAIAELEAQLIADADGTPTPRRPEGPRPAAEAAPADMAAPSSAIGDQVATREAFRTALARLGQADGRVVALDADVKNSTFSERFEAAHPDRFYQFFIAEQAMIGAS